MQYFNNSYVEFFKELQTNNNKEWFHQNKERYEQEVNIPFVNFIRDLLKKISSEDKSIHINTNDAIFRINRDIRFSKDKTPYKLFRSALISPAGRKSKTEPGFYIEIGINYLKMKGGAFKLAEGSHTLLEKHFEQIISISCKDSFATKFGEVSLQENGITFEAANSPDIIFVEDILDSVFDFWKSSRPVLKIIKTLINKK